MTALLAFDRAAMFSSAELDALKKAGAVAVSIYIVGTPGGSAHADKPYVDLIRSKGLGAYPNWERAANYLVTCGKAGGVSAGTEALAACRALGIPDNGTVAIAFSWDTDIDPSLYPQCGQVADGIIQGLGGHYLFTAYGQGGLIDFLVQTGRMKPGVEGWLSMSQGFPGFNAADPNVAMVQEHRADGTWFSSPIAGTDVDTITDPAHLHAYWPDNSPYGADMPLTATDLQNIAQAVWGYQMHAVQADGSTPVSGNHPAFQWLTDTRLAAHADALQGIADQVKTIASATGIDPVALAQSIAAHVKLAAA